MSKKYRDFSSKEIYGKYLIKVWTFWQKLTESVFLAEKTDSWYFVKIWFLTNKYEFKVIY